MPKEFPASRKRITLEEIKDYYKIGEYRDLVACVMELIEGNRIKPVQASKTNGKSPALYNAYHIIREQKDYSRYEEELKFQLSPLLDNEYYLKNLEKYLADREKVLQLSRYLTEQKDRMEKQISMNERSCEIWGREKYLTKEGGISLLKNLKFELDKLSVYETIEPIAYYSRHKDCPQNILIIENKDTFYSMRRHLLEGHERILGTEIGTLIYGGGKGISRAMKDLDKCVEPYIYNPENRMLYFGDLDYEGIIIYETLFREFGSTYRLEPFKRAYGAMMEKAGRLPSLPDTKKGQNRNIGRIFLDCFGTDMGRRMETLLQGGAYIAQEILNIMDFDQAGEEDGL